MPTQKLALIFCFLTSRGGPVSHRSPPLRQFQLRPQRLSGHNGTPRSSSVAVSTAAFSETSFVFARSRSLRCCKPDNLPPRHSCMSSKPPDEIRKTYLEHSF
ncbi:hypothetical protein JOB18_013081 [Solea senegalensis]|uniref:Secreted protein n=1 Tax=Solea senegalensis TaxID=28829 RepID=A0AAV6SFT9_SOLSE|nr:hypothetical protein JOB18_013081 [Solea senegalensis]